MSSSTYHVTVELSGGVAAAAGPVGLGDGLWCVGLDQTSPVNQTGTQTDTELSVKHESVELLKSVIHHLFFTRLG